MKPAVGCRLAVAPELYIVYIALILRLVAHNQMFTFVKCFCYIYIHMLVLKTTTVCFKYNQIGGLR